jgi:hybrid cluster-associated redox disulfide protein
MNRSLLTLESTVEEVLRLWPETAVVFQDLATACVGCDLAAFCTLNEAASEYQIAPDVLLQDLQNAIQAKAKHDA